MKFNGIITKSIAVVHRILGEKRLNDIRPDDIFLVSFPKSGNTWVRFLLGNLLAKDEEVNFHSIHQIIPEYESQKDFLAKTNSPRVIKSHSKFNPYFPKVIFILRDGRDALVSLYEYKHKDKPFGVYLSQHFSKENNWANHTWSWINKLPTSEIITVKYEDLLTSTVEELTKIVHFSGLPSATENLEDAVVKSSFRNMREIEISRGRKYQSNDDLKHFTRKGVKGDWKNYFGDHDRETFKNHAGDLLIKLGYEKDLNW